MVPVLFDFYYIQSKIETFLKIDMKLLNKRTKVEKNYSFGLKSENYVLGIGGIIAERLEEQLFRWLRAAELTCDRAALLVVQDPKVYTMCNFYPSNFFFLFIVYNFSLMGPTRGGGFCSNETCGRMPVVG